MKKSILGAVLLCAFLLCGVSCSKNGEEKIEPAVKLTDGKVEDNTISFTVTTENATACAYSYYTEGQDAPSKEEVILSGTSVSTSESASVTIEGLEWETTYTVMVAVKSGSGIYASQTITLTVDKEPNTIPELGAIIGAWEAEGYRWDLDHGKSACYLLTEDGYDFELDEDGNYITVTIREYCEQYAKDYNADPANEIKGTPEDFADHNFGGTYMFANINVTADEVVIYMGQRIVGQATLAVLCVEGSYTYDPQTGILTVDDVAIEDDPRSLEINVWMDPAGRMNFRYSDYDMFPTPTYDGSKSYYAYVPMIFYCMPGEAYSG